jgi:hypothetical protein
MERLVTAREARLSGDSLWLIRRSSSIGRLSIADAVGDIDELGVFSRYLSSEGWSARLAVAGELGAMLSLEKLATSIRIESVSTFRLAPICPFGSEPGTEVDITGCNWRYLSCDNASLKSNNE